VGPLDGITVLDLTWLLSGPFGTMTLCDLGAEVIKVERPPHGDVARTAGPLVNGESCFFFSLNRGKQSICVDLKTEKGRELFMELIERVDVLAQNYKPGVMERLGKGSDVLSTRNPRLIYAAISGFGQTGPDRERPALDIVIQGESGLMSITGEPGRPPVRAGLSLGDIAAGLYMAIGVLAALHERERSGTGQLLDISMLDCQMALLENALVRHYATGETPGPVGSRNPSATPFQAFPTKDGYIVIGLTSGVENQWPLFCAAIGRIDLIDDPRFQTNDLRTEHHSELEPILTESLRLRTTGEWIAAFAPFDIPCGPVNNIAQAAESSQVKAREMLVEVSHPIIGSLRMPTTPVKLSRTPGCIRGPSPAVGQDTAAVLSRLLGLNQMAIGALRKDGTVQ